MSTQVALWPQIRAVAGRDLLRERRRGEVTWVTLPFGAIALLLIPLAIGIDAPTLRNIGPGLYWIVVLLFGVLVTVRRTGAASDADSALSARLGIDPGAAFIGKSLANLGLLLAFQIVVGAVAVVLYDIPLDRWPWLFVIIPAAGVGLALLGTLAGSIAAGSGGSNLVPFLVAPLAIPLLLGATQALDADLSDGNGILAWVLLMLFVDLVLAVVGVLTARPLQETQ
ncbi:MAG TPA: heme exporter protein CcmB [Acidimicrobiia bacterium]|nr:heme exporter protein CcmB [Acidimicrobiia bacterium]